MGFRCLCPSEDVEVTFCGFFGVYGGLSLPGRIILLAPNLARPRLAAPLGAPTRPARGMPEFWIRQVWKQAMTFVSCKLDSLLHLN